ncbi:MAG: UDP-N-acetylmuramate dehydrogenase [Nitrospirae bacterium]|nr:UDP-N-acetylmuramate dehydrogenase [Nitrospirota bacterium]
MFREISLKGGVRFNEAMGRHTSFRIGGPAEVMFFPKDVPDLKMVLKVARTKGIPVFILGMGTNLLVRDGGIPGITINLKNLNKIKFLKTPNSELKTQNFIYAEAGVTLPKLLSFAAKNGLEGFEFTAGIPGALGGAIVMNAGTKEGEMKDVLDGVTLINNDGELVVVMRKDIPFGYRRSGLGGMVIVGATLRLRRGEPDDIKKRIRVHLEERAMKEPSGLPNAGSIFKNPESDSAGKIIEEIGLKGFRMGDAEISQVHANFIVNKGKAKASDVISLMRVIEERVFKEKGIILEPEIRIVGVNDN